MRDFRQIITMACAAACMLPGAAFSRTSIEIDTDIGAGSGPTGSAFAAAKPPGHLECVPYARTTSGIQIYGDAWTWWNQARGRYATGTSPRVGSVMAIKPFNNSRLGHVATVSRIVDDRTVLLSHANWSVPGQIERNVTALDVSPANDWSRVRIWYGPAKGLGTTQWPVSGFIYNAKPGRMTARTDAGMAAPRDNGGASVRKNGRAKDPIGDIIAGVY